MSGPTRILIGLLTGLVLGLLAKFLAGGQPWLEVAIRNAIEPMGRMWLGSLIMVVIPLILSTLALGVAGLGDLKRLGRVGLVTLICFLGLTTLSTALGLGAMNLLKPGNSLDPVVKVQLMDTYKGDTAQIAEKMGLSQANFDINLLVNIVPRNPLKSAANGDMLAVIFFALVLGAALARMPKAKAEPLIKVLESLGEAMVTIIDMVMKVAPLGVFCLIFSVMARFGYELLLNLMKYVFTVLGSLLVFQVLGYGVILKLLARRAPLDFLRRIRVVMVTAFSTSSSNATLPTTIQTAEQELGISPQVAGFVLPLGATMNMNGTALFEGATVLFLAQVFGVHLSLPQQLVVVLMSVVTAIGVAGIPGGSLPLLMMVLGMVGVPPEGIALILGVDRLLDMSRTVLNVTGDLVTATLVERFCGNQAAALPPEEAPG
jgi:DAACS family dicarboxylate/amino acid:cation (Na+ or H+) symporter